MTEKYYKVMVAMEFQAESPKDAIACAAEVLTHVWKTGGSSSIACPESMDVVGEPELVAEVEI